MEKWLEAFAKGLLIQKTTEEGSKTEPANEEQIQAFKKALEENLAYQGTYRQPGDAITYDYLRGTVRGRHKWQEITQTEIANSNLISVFAEMPRLSDGESYVFPVPTFITFKMRDRASEKDEFVVINVCHWIRQNL